MIVKKEFTDLLNAGVHFGHLKSKWNPKMAPYIFTEKDEIHLIDLNKTLAKLEEAKNAARKIAKSGKKILFVGTKKQAKSILKNYIAPTKMPYITERWFGGMLTNFSTIRKAVKRISVIENLLKVGSTEQMSKKEKLVLQREIHKLETYLGTIKALNRLPSAIFVIDTIKEKIAIHEAKLIGIPIFAITDTNSDPEGIQFLIPGNDDATESIEIIIKEISDSINEGLAEREKEKLTTV